MEGNYTLVYAERTANTWKGITRWCHVGIWRIKRIWKKWARDGVRIKRFSPEIPARAMVSPQSIRSDTPMKETKNQIRSIPWTESRVCLYESKEQLHTSMYVRASSTPYQNEKKPKKNELESDRRKICYTHAVKKERATARSRRKRKMDGLPACWINPSREELARRREKPAVAPCPVHLIELNLQVTEEDAWTCRDGAPRWQVCAGEGKIIGLPAIG